MSFARYMAVLMLPVLGSTFAQANEQLPVDPTGRLNEENLARVCDAHIRHYLEGFIPQAYSLTAVQEEAFRARLAELKKEQIRYSLTVAAERAELSQAALAEMGALMVVARATHSRPSSENAPVRARLRAIREKEPLFNEERVREAAEALLPSEQVAAGRPRYDEMVRNARQAYFAQWNREELAVGPGSRRMLQNRDQWAWFVERFCAACQLNAEQRSTAGAILRDVKARRDRYVQEHRSEWDALMDSALRASVNTGTPASQPSVDRREFFAPIEGLWEEMCERLDTIPTAAQVETLKRERPTVPATRPTDYVTPRSPTSRPAAGSSLGQARS